MGELAANGASTLIDFAVKAGLADTLTGEGPFTVFAPTNAAFAALPQEIVDAVSADVKASNGVIHFIDGVMLIPKGDLVDTLVGDDRFSTLVAAVTAAGLVDTVKNAEAFTIFAPTNDAFAKIPEATLNGLLADKEALTKVLLRHVAPGAVFAKGVSWGNIATAGGENVCTKVFKTGAVKVSNAMVVEADITATNGVIHAINTVI